MLDGNKITAIYAQQDNLLNVCIYLVSLQPLPRSSVSHMETRLELMRQAAQ